MCNIFSSEEGRVKVNIFDDYAVMSVKEAESLDNANFKVNISNDAGMDTASFTIKVLGKYLTTCKYIMLHFCLR